MWKIVITPPFIPPHGMEREQKITLRFPLYQRGPSVKNPPLASIPQIGTKEGLGVI